MISRNVHTLAGFVGVVVIGGLAGFVTSAAVRGGADDDITGSISPDVVPACQEVTLVERAAPLGCDARPGDVIIVTGLWAFEDGQEYCADAGGTYVDYLCVGIDF